MDKRLMKYIPTITMLPAILIGVVAMYINDVPTFIYMQNVLCFVVLVLAYFITLKSKLKLPKVEPIVFIIISILALALSFFSSGTDGVHRWVAVGPLQLYVSAIVLPIVIINLWELIQEDKLVTVIISIVCVSIILTLQPDASMMTAFGVCSVMLLWNKINKLSRFLCVAFLGGLTAYTWVFLDDLEPVSYVEGIFKMVMDIGILGLVFGVISIAVMIVPFLLFPPNKNKIVSVCFGVYFIIILLSNIVGEFPVPLMGFGVSPIIGYFISIVWYTKSKNEMN